VSVPKDKASAAASESGTHKQKRKKEKLIRLDDLLPKGNVTGGRQVVFGASDTQQTTQENKE
jgi:hypothetical protein